MLKKMLRARGLTLSEMLVTCLILALVSAVVATGITIAIKTHQKSVMASESAILSSTLTQALQDELRFSQNRSFASGKLEYTSGKFGSDVTLDVSAQGYLTVEDKLLINEKSYTDFIVSDIIITQLGQSIAVSFTLSDPNDFNYETNFTVSPLNS